ncbi:MAG: homoserine O-acetyltransferase [Bacteroidota bacterium]
MQTLNESVTRFIDLFDASHPLVLESAETLAPVTVAYETYGTLNEEGTNAILICHALTASASAAQWWGGLVGPGKVFDPERYFIVCPNILGSCYGTTGPVSVNPETGEPYRLSFPQITVRDIVRVQKKLLDRLGVTRLVTMCGSSLGGMQVLEWAVMFPELCESIIPISTSSQQSTWCIALNTVARNAIMGDPEWKNGFYTRQPERGLGLARMVGMISYRSAQEFEERFGRTRQYGDGNPFDFNNPFQVESYLAHQGRKLADRFDANTYLLLSHAVDSHDIARGRGSVAHVLHHIRATTLCIGVSTDIRYPVREQQELVRWIPHARYAEIDSIHGHDAFLIEFDQLNEIIGGFLRDGEWI